MTLPVLRSSFARPRILNYRNYKFFNNTFFRDQVLWAGFKSRFMQANQAPFVNKEIQLAVMVRSKLRKKFPKSRSKSDKKACNKQRNKCFSLLRKTQKAYYSNLNVKDIVDNKRFWIILKLQKLLTNISKLSA